ncbi:hypothetical protein IMSHALPRED_003835 [Imshaugia aleurites]|uniref:Uncharacterized protein n=1 Tax=Imshaugia aleurites TaxID=172621 RepID=A0A8H3F2F6_9LECA|nr:hypothetical protein IMSHALPRED_003835 [Imshaugia aleurites]
MVSEGQSTDIDSDMDDVRSMPGDSINNASMTEALVESRQTHCASAPPTVTAPPEDSGELPMDLPPLPPLPSLPSTFSASESVQSIFARNTDTATSFVSGDGLNVAGAWLITESLAPRSHPIGWPLHPPSASITASPPTTASPVHESFTQTINPALLEQSLQSDYNQAIGPVPENTGYDLDPFADDFSGNQTSIPMPPTSAQTFDPTSIDQATYQLNYVYNQNSAPGPHDSAQTITSMSQPFDQTMSPIAQDFGQAMSSMPQSFGQTIIPTPQTFGEATNLMPQPFDQAMSAIPQTIAQPMNPISQTFGGGAYQFPGVYGPTSTPVLQDFGQSLSSMPSSPLIDIHRISNPVPLGFSGHIVSPTPQHVGQTTSHLPYQGFRNRRSDDITTISDSEVTPGTPPTIIRRKRKRSDNMAILSDNEMDSDTPSHFEAIRRKRRLSYSLTNRSLRASTRPRVPSYLIKESEKYPGQQRAIDWTKTEAREKFQDFYRKILAQWGVKSGHEGTCVLMSEMYRALEPLELMSKFTWDNCAVPDSPCAFYSYDDYGTTVARAKAWFSEPRTGLDHDDLVGSNDCAPKGASHTCDHGQCIIHVTWEKAGINVGREKCREEARRLRSKNVEDVPEHCTNPKHDPPCLMQHIALTTFEVYCIQFAVLRQAKGLTAIPPEPRPKVIDERLAETKWTANLWRTYWVNYSDGGKRDAPTTGNFRQMENRAFG